ncbi:MAG: Holliday junction resolvase RuvX [Acidimicrobiia bacterium]|nr:MAG: Holliday junction resolvase RuvX [Acidimicrobiia bacterium]
MGRILGLDPGERRVGVAVADPTGTIASPDRFIDRTREDVADAVAGLCEEYGASLIVVGLPVTLDGREGSAAASARALGAEIATATGVDVVFHDERFTTVTADQALISGGVRRRKRKEKRDQVAAAVMLQAYLDSRRQDAEAGDNGDARS